MKYVIDSDGGGDDLWAIAILLGRINNQDVLGITTVFGNTDVKKATRNVCDFLSFIGHGDIKVYEGSDFPLSPIRPFGDNAYGAEGIGNTKLLRSNKTAEKLGADQWLKNTLNQTDEPITIFCLGPATNIAKLYKQNPELENKDIRIVAMNGAVMPVANSKISIDKQGRLRKGNITIAAEFNAFQDPMAIATLIKPDIDLTLVPMDTAHKLTFGEKVSRDIIQSLDNFGEGMLNMLALSSQLDMNKFDVDGGFLYDPHAIIWALEPSLYREKTSVFPYVHTHNCDKTLETSDHGSVTLLLEDTFGRAHAVPSIKDPKEVNEFIIESLSSYKGLNFAV